MRSLKIAWIFAYYRLDTFFDQPLLPWYVRGLCRLLPWRYFVPAKRSQSERLRLALEALGPVFIKFGQMLSTRRDLLPEDLAEELARLQDRVPPFSGERARRIIERELKQPIEAVFARFDIEPMASASVAQVHAATLHTGQEVVVKVIRPGIGAVIRQDVALLYLIARLVHALWAEGRRLRPVEVVSEYEQTIFDELDLRKEAANGSQLRRNFDRSSILYVPEVFWDYTRQHILVMERIHGIPVADIAQLEAQGSDMKKLAERGVEIFFTQVFRDSFFHADMHPGNIFVSRDNPSDPQYIAVDFGIIGSLNAEDQSYLARNILAFFKRDYRQVAQLHIDSGWVPRDTNVHAFETAIRSVCEPIFEKPLKDISFGMVLLGLFQTARRFNMEVQPQLVLLQKTLLNIEGLGRQLYPELDLWQTAKPFLENWMQERMGAKAVYRHVKAQAPEWLEKLPHLPQMVYDSLEQLKLHSAADARVQLLLLERRQTDQQRQRRHLLLGSALLIGAVLIAQPEYRSLVAGWPWYAYLSGGLGGLLLWRA
ncbi:ubiquinone biosynthesis regulatory protein kinase UbiB [Marinobacterium marinum]|uniref:Probable protein kinase UbiB n=1 Tax=Marinobacterium marinum TaxID=2756129 RepID=A0A7W2ACX8_9GAMM|nr:ubiquinone biosynthesis regulatory protein kinase UbiB [Marinobacterium marinum]MBA4502979.1 ubiquinone biosynthesis regulatory protein kinase UbiB [Marinobacterium marinum]